MKVYTIAFLFAVFATVSGGYEIGVGISDVTGPIVGVTFMGYGNVGQQGTGLHLRQWARAYVISDGENRVVFVSVDAGMMGDGVRTEVIKYLEEKYNGLYNMDNVMISATHTHSGVAGFLMHTLFDASSFGFSNDTFQAYVSGIVKSVVKAHENIQKGKIFLTKGTVLNANINRSPTAYEANPEAERARYLYNVDKELTQLKFISESGTPLGVLNWYAVHPTSMNYSNTLVSSDNVGYASVMFEEKMNPGRIIGKGSFVASFASSNLGDVSPNLMGPKCQKSGQECNAASACNSMFDSCYSLGPGEDMFESTRIIAERLFNKSWELWKSDNAIEIKGPVRSIHQYVDMPTAEAEIYNETSGKMEKVHGCRPAMGYSFAAGTTDGSYATFITQGMKESFWWLDLFRNFALSKPSPEDVECHYPKPILLPTGQLSYPYEWQPRIVSTQLATIGNLAIACVPGEFTTMAGRRVRDAVKNTLGDKTEVIVAGLCNTYSDYITTFEEYQVQRFEGAANLYGPHTLSIHLKQYQKLAETLLTKQTLERGPEPQGLEVNKMISFIPPVVFDTPDWLQNFGDVSLEPVNEARIGDVVRATFVAGHPRNDLKLDDTYCLVERQDDVDLWTVVATDANWETKIHWRRTSWLFGQSEIDIEWKVPKNTKPGFYRIRHFGNFKTLSGNIRPYEGVTKTFQVAKSSNVCLAATWCKNALLCSPASENRRGNDCLACLWTSLKNKQEHSQKTKQN